MSVNLFDKLNSNLYLLHKQLGSDNVSIAHVTGTDIFYTDGAASGAFFKINPLGIYFKEDGTEHFCWSTSLTAEMRAIINNWIQTIKQLL